MTDAFKYEQAPDTLLFDLDGTVTNFPEYAVYTNRAMMHAIFEYTGIPEADIIRAMQRHYAARGFESPTLLQSMEAEAFFGDFIRNETRKKELYKRVRRAFNAAKTKRLKPYPGMPELLHTAKKQGRQVIALTDARTLSTCSKLKSHKAQLLGRRHFSRLIAIRDAEEPLMESRERFSKALRRSLQIPLTETDTEKPDTHLEELLGMSAEEIGQRVAIFGDNYSRDMALANRFAPMRGFHALHGVRDSERFMSQLNEIYGLSGSLPNAHIPSNYPPNIRPFDDPSELYEPLGLEKP
ncbi:HAD family hydrolase [Candidatus Peregrinibacteria bacterium]|nr:HAD family hydrolase [Candidatus Peregrinibacteria bacterium]